MLQHFIPKFCCLLITTGWLTMGGRGKTTKQTNPRSQLETEDAKGHRSSHCWKKELQDSPNSVAMLYSCHLQVSVLNALTHKARFQPCLPAAINAGRRTETGLLYSQTSPKQAQVYFSKVAVFKSLPVDMSMISRLMLSTSSQTDEQGINTKIKVVILHVFSPHLWRVTSSEPWLRVAQDYRTLWKSKKLGICCSAAGEGQFLSAFSLFSSPLPTAPSRGSFFPFSHLYQEYAK